MICRGMRVRLLPHRYYPKDPSKNVDCEIGEDKYGTFRAFQIIDYNRPKEGGKPKSGWMYLKIHTNLPLGVGDVVTIDNLEYIQRKNNVVVLAVTIKESSPFDMQRDNLGENDIGF